MKALTVAVAVAVAVAGCSTSTQQAKPAPTSRPEPAAKLKEKRPVPTSTGKTTITGTARNAKLGALVQGDRTVWVDKLNEWPDALLNKKVQVSGKLVKRADLPVVVQPKEGEPQVSGIPVPEGTDLKKAAERWVMEGAAWALE